MRINGLFAHVNMTKPVNTFFSFSSIVLLPQRKLNLRHKKRKFVDRHLVIGDKYNCFDHECIHITKKRQKCVYPGGQQ